MRPPAADVAAVLAETAALGAYFHVDLVPPPDVPGVPDASVVRTDAPSEPSLADLYAGDPALRADIHETARRLGTPEARVGGSILFQGLAARLWSPVLAAAVLYDRALVLPPRTTWWSLRRDGGRLRTAGPTLGEHGAAGAREVVRSVVDSHLVPLVAAIRAEAQVPAALLWGNAASALLGSAGVLVRARPDRGPAAAAVVEALFAEDPLATAGRLSRPAEGGRPSAGIALPRLVRASCCLYYRVPGGGLCGDCALTSIPGEPPGSA